IGAAQAFGWRAHADQVQQRLSISIDGAPQPRRNFFSSLFRLMDWRVAGPTGEPNSARESELDRGERCAASRAFNGSIPTANLVSIIKGKGSRGTDSWQSEAPRRASHASFESKH